MTLEYFVSLLIALILAGLVQAGAQAALLAYLLRTRRRRTGQPTPAVETLAGTPSESASTSSGPPPACFRRTFRYEDGHTERRDYWTHEPNTWTPDNGQELYRKARLVEIKDDPK